MAWHSLSLWQKNYITKSVSEQPFYNCRLSTCCWPASLHQRSDRQTDSLRCKLLSSVRFCFNAGTHFLAVSRSANKSTAPTIYNIGIQCDSCVPFCMCISLPLALSQNCEKRLSASSGLSVRPHGTTWILLDRFSLNSVFEYFSKVCSECSSFTKIEQK
jgi:hypothetical protein